MHWYDAMLTVRYDCMTEKYVAAGNSEHVCRNEWLHHCHHPVQRQQPPPLQGEDGHDSGESPLPTQSATSESTHLASTSSLPLGSLQSAF